MHAPCFEASIKNLPGVCPQRSSSLPVCMCWHAGACVSLLLLCASCRYVEEYHMSDIERELGVDRGRLVSLLQLVQSPAHWSMDTLVATSTRWCPWRLSACVLGSHTY